MTSKPTQVRTNACIKVLSVWIWRGRVIAHHLLSRLPSQTIPLAQATEAGVLYINPDRKEIGVQATPLFAHTAQGDPDIPKDTQWCYFQIWEWAHT